MGDRDKEVQQRSLRGEGTMALSNTSTDVESDRSSCCADSQHLQSPVWGPKSWEDPKYVQAPKHVFFSSDDLLLLNDSIKCVNQQKQDTRPILEVVFFNLLEIIEFSSSSAEGLAFVSCQRNWDHNNQRLSYHSVLSNMPAVTNFLCEEHFICCWQQGRIRTDST